RYLSIRNCDPGSELEPERVRLGHATQARGVEWRDGARAVEPAVLVELARQHRLEVVARELGLRPVDDADRALEARLGEPAAELPLLAQREQEGRDARLVALALVALGVARPHFFHPHGAVPVVGGGDGAAVGAEADEI